jgi:hypothetical protein
MIFKIADIQKKITIAFLATAPLVVKIGKNKFLSNP